ncbi:Hsp70 family protein [Mycobacterium riyadhense]|uniref:Chaperone protein DnaK n=1 Tax=Mycobacterium riyadhense TaxID=486698 RepID=A0A653ELU7_9MYCO|nr:Hsp70 family protein [Mycobacterium riyadhense]VTO97591.1 Chaperone protein DnaK [Mycobacterium riyadhense]
MAAAPRSALGLSIGATNLAAVTADHALTRKPVLTLYRQRPSEVGVPPENPRLYEPGLVITDFVDRVGDPVEIVAADGSMHRSEALVADGLRALGYAATGGRPLPDSVAVTYPAHWGPAAVDALSAALSRVSEWSRGAQPPSLIPDAAAALFAVRANPGLPARGIVAVCDFGGSGSSITVVDADGEYQPVAATVRYHDFCGDLIDQALLTYVMAEIPSTGPFDPAGTFAIGSLARLRTECRNAKQQLSSSTVTTLGDLPGMRGEVRLTRNELEDTIRGSLDGFVGALDQTLGRSGIRAAKLVAIVSVGGVANIPAITTTLSGRFGVPVVTTPRPQLTAAIGAALRAAGGPADASATVLTPKASTPPVTAPAVSAPAPAANGMVDAPVSVLQPALAWSEADDDSRATPAGTGEYPGSLGGSGFTAARPQLSFDRDSRVEAEPKPTIIPWYRLPAVIIIGTVVAVLLVGTAVVIGLSSSDNKPAPATGVTTVPSSSAPPAAPPSTDTGTTGPTPETSQPAPPTQQAPPPPPAPATETPLPTTPPPPTTTEAPPATTTPPPVTTTPPPSPTSAPVTTLPSATTQSPAPQAPALPNPPPIPPVPPIPDIPQIPGISRGG